MFGVMFLLIALELPIAFALIVAAFFYLFTGTQIPPSIVVQRMSTGIDSFPLLAIPLFILAGGIMNASSISRRLINLASALLGFIRGGLAIVTVGASMFFAEISGSAVADVAALGEEGRAKPPERVIVGYIPAAGTRGPRYRLHGSDREFLRMNSNSRAVPGASAARRACRSRSACARVPGRSGAARRG